MVNRERARCRVQGGEREGSLRSARLKTECCLCATLKTRGTAAGTAKENSSAGRASKGMVVVQGLALKV